MNFREIFFYEIRYQLRRLPTWIYFGAVVGMVLLVLTEMLESEARSGGNLYTSAPFLIGMSMVICSMTALVITASIFGDAAARDAEARMDPLFFTALRQRRNLRGKARWECSTSSKARTGMDSARASPMRSKA